MTNDDAKLALENTVKLLNDNGIHKICLIQGTLLGAYRDNNIVENDHDIDLVLFGVSAQKFNELEQIFIDDDFIFHESLEDKFLSVRRGTAIIDIQLGVFEDDFFITESPVTIDKYPKHLFTTFKTIELFGMKFLAPSNIEKCLELTYGDWKTPRINTERDNHFERIWKI